jgi:hypothetical protein
MLGGNDRACLSEMGRFVVIRCPQLKSIYCGMEHCLCLLFSDCPNNYIFAVLLWNIQFDYSTALRLACYFIIVQYVFVRLARLGMSMSMGQAYS